MAAPIREFRKMAIPLGKRFRVYLKSLPNHDGPVEASRGVLNEETGMEKDEETV